MAVILFSLFLLLSLPSVFAQGGDTFWQKYDWYIIGAAGILFVYVLFKVTKKLLIVGTLIVAAAIVANIFLGTGTEAPQIGVVGDIHDHADFKVYLNGLSYNFAREKYMSAENMTLSNFAHFHDLKGNIIHKHASGITLGFFLDTLGMQLDGNCFVLDDGTSYCNKGNKKLKLYVNGEKNDEFDQYDIQDEDRIMISYGDETAEEIKKQLASATDEACIYSLKCPEKGAPPEEATCVGETCGVEG